MTDSLHRSIFASKDLSQANSQGITEADVLITAALATRPARQPDLAAENQALRTLAQHVMDEPQSLLKTLVGIALDLCRADTVGVSLLETAPNGESIFRWVALAGALEQLEQTTTPANFSPCGTTLACNQPQLYSHPERYFTYLYHPQFPIAEGLLIPLSVKDCPLGTLWIVSHDEARHFDAEEQRLMMSLGSFSASALHGMQQLHQRIKTALCQSQEFNQQILDSSNDCIKVLDLEGRILFMSGGGQASLSIPDITPFLNTSWVEFWPESERLAATEAINRARAGEVCTIQGYCPTLSGEPKWWDNKVSPIRGVDGQVERLLCISRDITERKRIEDARKQAQEKLRESEARYRAIVNQAITGVACTNLNGKFTLVNQKYCEITSYSAVELSQLRMHDITHPEDLPRNVELYNRMLAEGTPFEIEKRYIRKDGSIIWVNNSVSAICDREGKPQSVVGIVLDITDRKQAELNAEFLATVSQDLVEATCVEEILRTVGERLNRYLKTSVCAFVEINERADKAAIHYDWHQEDVPSLVGVYRLPEFVTNEFFQAAKAGQTIIVRDVSTDPRIADQQRFAAIKIGSFINVPLIRDDEWKFTLGIYHQTPYNWRTHEIELMRELASRIWTKLERTRVEAALRESEAKYRMLFESIDEGFCICEMLFDEKNEPIDYRFLEVNPIFETLTGLEQVVGKTARELIPNLEAEWFEIYGNLVLTGNPIRFQQQSMALNRWFDVNAFCIGEPQNHQFAILFTDISDRKKVEQEHKRFLAVGSDLLVITGVDGYFHWVSPTLERLLGWTKDEMTSHPWTEFVHPDDISPSIAETDSLFSGNQTFAFENRYRHKDGSYRWLLWNAQPYPEEQVIYGAAVDITDRKRREANLAFLAEISNDFSRLSTANEIMQVVGAKIGAYLKITTCNFTDVDEAWGEVTVHYGWNSTDVPSTVGTFRISQYLSEEFERASRAGETVIIRDTQLDPRTDSAGYAALNMYSFVTVPFHRNGRWTHYIAVCDSRPRDWRDDEIELIEEISNRIFPRLERACAEAALRVSEAKYRSLFESMDEGFCILQLIFDEEQKPIDYRYIEINPVFEQQTGMKNALGRTMRELVPDIEPFWFDIYGTVALTGEPTRFANYSQSMGRWFDVYTFRIGEPHERKVAVLFNDISDRKQAEETLQQAHNALRQQANQLQQANEILQSTLEELQVTQEELHQQNEQLAIARELAEREGHRYQDLFNFAPDGYVVTDAQGIIQEANQAIAALVAIDQHYLVNTPLAAYICEPDRRAFRNLLYELHSSSGVQKLQTDELSLQHLGRHPASVAPIPVAITGTAIYDAQAKIVGVRWLIQDITDRKRAEAAVAADLRDTQLLRDLSARLTTEADIQVLYDEILAAAIALMRADAGSFQSLDNATQELLLLATQGLSQTMTEHFNRINTSFNTSCGIALATGERSFIDFDAPQSDDPNGYRRMHVDAGYLSAQSTPLISRSGKLIGMVSTHWRTHHRPTERELRFLDLLARQAADLMEQRRDEAERKQLLEQEQAVREEAERANRIKDEFLAVLSHELRSPLNPILGWSKLLQSRKLDETKTLQALSTIERNAKLQSELIEDLLDVSRILQGKLSLNVAPINLASIIRAAMETVRLAAQAKSIEVEASLAPDVGLVSGDSTRLQQVIWNLLSNAVKFTPPRGQVNIRLEHKDAHALITVSDTGQGIAPEFLPYVFDYFRQANATTTRKFGGLGLGLAIVRHLVELHGGTVRAESPGEGQGATFVVRLPLMPTPLKPNPDERPPEQSPDLNGIKILVVDDETDTRELVAFLLEQQGAQVTVATSAHEALLVLTQAKPDVLLSDIGMPDMDGYMLIQQVRTLAPEQGGQIPAIALTAYAGETNQQQVIAAGFQKHISKPIAPEVLVQAIAQLVRLT